MTNNIYNKEGSYMGDIKITNSGIKRILNKYTYLKSIAEYIWNGFDAKANCVEINLHKNILKEIDEISIIDNGYGIDRTKLSEKFTPFFDSEKVINPDEKRKVSLMHGKNGVGRLTFFCFASNAKWETIYKDKSTNRNIKYEIYIDDQNLTTYIDKNIQETFENTGTKVTFTNLHNSINENEIIDFIKKEFCWFLELNKERNFNIKVNDKKVDYSDIILDEEKEELIYEKTKINFKIKFVQWRYPLTNEYSRFYFIDSNDIEKYKETTTLNKKADQFYHSIYIKSSLFNNFSFDSDDSQTCLFNSKSSDEYKFLMNSIEKLLKEKRKSFLRKSSEKLIDNLEKANAYPKFDKDNFIDQYKKSQLDDLISALYQAQPKIFTSLNDIQKKTFVHFLNLIMDSDEKEQLFEILNEIIELEEEDKTELLKLLKYSKLTNIIKTIKLIKDRFKAIEELKCLVFNKDLNANEIPHLQAFIESHYWIFGEQYHLVTAAEPNFEEALRRYCYILTGETEKKKIEHENKYKQMDIFAVRQDIQNDIINNIVVELKHPNIKLGTKQFYQVQEYMDVILKQHQFNAPNMFWEFYLVGNDYDNYISGLLKNAQPHGERSLAYKVDNYKIYIKKWSEIIAEFEIKHKFLNEKLELERKKLIDKNYISADEIIDNISNNTAVQPKEIVMPSY